MEDIMTQREQLDALCLDMTAHDIGDPKRIQHFMKVSAFAALIGRMEAVDEHTLFILEAVGYIHDIGIRIAEETYGYQTGELQERLGPPAARKMLENNGFEQGDTDRICWLIAHHHSFNNIEGIDYQILVEADFLVNLMERGSDRETCLITYEKIFRTETGKKLCRLMFLEDRGFDMSQVNGQKA